MDELEAELAEVKRLKQVAWKKMDEDAKGARRVEQAAQSQFTAKLLESVNNLRVGVVAPNVTINVNGALARSYAKVPPERIESCINDEVRASSRLIFGVVGGALGAQLRSKIGAR
jgi:hypothetical protein